MRRFSQLVLLSPCLASFAAALGCAPVDDRMPLEDCERGRYWADCGGDAEPVIGCDQETGECRWFRGGETAFGHVAAECSPGSTCCDAGWPFASWSPSGDVLERAANDLGFLHANDISSSYPTLISVALDHAGATEAAAFECESGWVAANFMCGGLTYERAARLDGDALLITIRTATNERFEIDVSPATADGRHARVWRLVPGPSDSRVDLRCGPGWGGAFAVESGMLHLSPTAFEAASEVHGRLEAVTDGNAFSVTF